MFHPHYPRDPEIVAGREASRQSGFPYRYSFDTHDWNYIIYFQCRYCGYVFHLRHYLKRRNKEKLTDTKLRRLICSCKKCKRGSKRKNTINVWKTRFERVRKNPLDEAVARMELEDLVRPLPGSHEYKTHPDFQV